MSTRPWPHGKSSEGVINENAIPEDLAKAIDFHGHLCPGLVMLCHDMICVSDGKDSAHFGAAVFKAKVGTGVFIAARAVVQEVHVPANTFVPSLAFLSEDRVGRLRKTDPRERRFMEEVAEANLKLAEGHLGLGQAKGAADGQDT